MEDYSLMILLLALALVNNSTGFSTPTNSPRCENMLMMLMTSEDIDFDETQQRQQQQQQQQQSSISSTISRRQWYRQCSVTVATIAMTTFPKMGASAADSIFVVPLVDYNSIKANNKGASKSRRMDNSNVIFVQDHYYIFGTAPPFIPKGDTSFPEKMPFVSSTKRYEAMKKYRERVQRGIDLIDSIKGDIEKDNYNSILAADAPEYSTRPFGLLAYAFLASETGPTNELYLARWYINEFYLDVNEVKTATSKVDALAAYSNAIKALNSVLVMLNRSITSKVGDPFVLLE